MSFLRKILGGTKSAPAVDPATDPNLIVPSDDPGPAVGRLADALLASLSEHAGVRPIPIPPWYRTPSARNFPDYLLRLEQQLAVACARPDTQRGILSGEHEVLDGILRLCAMEPANETLRMVLIETLRQMKQVRPDILPEYREGIALLQREHPLAGDVGRLVADAIDVELVG